MARDSARKPAVRVCLIELVRQVSQHGRAGFFGLSERFEGRAADLDTQLLLRFYSRAHERCSRHQRSLSGAANFGSEFLGARIFDTDMYGLFAKYVFNLAKSGPLSTSDSKLTVNGGYQRITFSNPSDGGYGPGHTTIGGYEIGPIFSTNASVVSGVVNYAYTGGRSANRREFYRCQISVRYAIVIRARILSI
jgi:hypothetical protein